MNYVAPRASSDIALLKAKEAKRADALAGAAIEFATRMQDWAAVDHAVDAKLDNQQEFVDWWHDNVRKPGKRSNIPDRGYFVSQAVELTGIRPQQVSRWARRLEDRQAYRELIVGAAYRQAMAEAYNHRGHYTGECEWYTPFKYIELVRGFLGGIDLDPASSAAAQQTVRAATFYTAQTDGLAHDWHGRVWLNPPYAQPLIAEFVQKMVAEVQAGHVTEAVMLTHNSTDTAWFHMAQRACAAICFTVGRIAFVHADAAVAAPTQGQAFFYYGRRAREFAQVFGSCGFVVLPALTLRTG